MTTGRDNSALRLALIAIALIVLLGGAFHDHRFDSDRTDCAVCHSGVQVASPGLPGFLQVPVEASAEFITPPDSDIGTSDPNITAQSPRPPPSLAFPCTFREGLDQAV